MDPNATLREIRALCRSTEPFSQQDAERFAELFHALDSWLAGAGFLPSDWERK